MKLSGAISQTRTETEAPFALFGDDGGTSLKIGSYELVLESYNSTTIVPNNAIGRSVFNFVVINQRVNQAPVLLSTIVDQQTTINRTFNFLISSGIFQDKDGQISRVTISGLPTGLKAAGWQISGTPTQAGTFTVTVEVFDNENASVKTQFTIRVASTNQGPTPTMTLPDQSVMVQQSYEFNIPVSLFTDSDGYVVRIIAQNIPSGISFVNGKLTGKPAVAGDYRVLIRAVDNEGAWGETSFRLLVKETTANLPPLADNAIPNQFAKVGSTFTFTLPKNTFRDPEGSEIRTEVTNLPPGLSFNSGTIFGLPSTAGEFKVTVRGYDNVGASVPTSFTISVSLANNNIPPSVVSPIADQNATVGESFSLPVPISIFRDPDGSLFGLLVRNLPPGLVFQGGKIMGTPTTAGSYTVTVKAIDNQGASAEDYFVIKVVSPVTVTTDFAFSLYKAGGSASRSFVRSLRHNDRILASSLPSFINIFAEAIPQVDRIEFTMTGPIEVNFTDYNSPYGLFDDNGGFSSVPGTYTLKVKGFKNNKSVGETTIQFVLTDGKSARIGEDETVEKTEWATYPNPFSGSLKVTVPVGYQPALTDFTLSNLSGQSHNVREVKWEEQQVELHFESFHLPKGMYFLQVRHPDFPKKIIKILKEE
jgi:hypothetical protein